MTTTEIILTYFLVALILHFIGSYTMAPKKEHIIWDLVGIVTWPMVILLIIIDNITKKRGR
jgi:hypothetical protein